jgi:hypothetical protein
MPSATTVPTATPGGSPEPTGDLPGFACSMPLHITATTVPALIHDIRVGTHPGYDRIVWEFVTGIPDVTIAVATPPFIADPSGLPLTVHGTSFLKIVMQGGTVVTAEGQQSFSGSTSLTPGYPRLVELRSGGDFEGVSTWYLGMSGGACVRAFTLTAPDRVVIDLQQ